MKIVKIIDKFFEISTDGLVDSPAARVALTETFANIKALTITARVPVGVFRAYPGAFTHKLLTGALKIAGVLSQTPTAAELVVARDTLYGMCTAYLQSTTTPLPADLSKADLRAELAKLITHARSFNLVAMASPSLAILCVSDMLITNVVRTLFVVIDRSNSAALRTACASVRASRGLPEIYAPPIKGNEISAPDEVEGDVN
jgi:hypothetical protein